MSSIRLFKPAYLFTGLVAAFILVGVIRAMAGHGLIKDLDKDADQMISWDEASAAGWSLAMFDLKDMDSDGYIDRDDLSSHALWAKSPMLDERILTAMDVDGDGQIQSKEGWWWSGKSFSKYDRNADGILSPKELSRVPRPKDPKLFKQKLLRARAKASQPSRVSHKT